LVYPTFGLPACIEGMSDIILNDVIEIEPIEDKIRGAFYIQSLAGLMAMVSSFTNTINKL
jgi:hypothetical protein